MQERGTTMFYILTKEILNFSWLFFFGRNFLMTILKKKKKTKTIAYDDINKIIFFLNKIKT